MHFFFIIWLLTLLRVMGKSHFVSPRSYSPNGNGKYGGNARWQLGSSQLVGFQTNWTAYDVELWQQPLGTTARKAANVVYNQMEGADLPQSFYWTVQTYDLLLSDSPLFFFSLQDNNSPDRQPSPFFNITIGTTPMSSTTTEDSTTQTTTSASSISAVSTETSFPASSPSGYVVMTQGISAGAAAGIGVGVASGVVLLAVMIWFIFRRRIRDQQQQPVEIQGRELELPRHYSIEKKPIVESNQQALELPG